MTSSTDSTQETWTAAIRYITGRKSAEEALGFLAHISSLLDTDQGPAEWGRAVARVCVPYLAAAVSVDITGVDGPVDEPADRFESTLRELRERAASSGEQVFVVSAHPKLAGTAQAPPERDPSFGSAAVVRLAFRGRASGALVILRGPTHPKGPIGPADLALISELANRLALGNAFTEVSARASTVTG